MNANILLFVHLCILMMCISFFSLLHINNLFIYHVKLHSCFWSHLFKLLLCRLSLYSSLPSSFCLPIPSPLSLTLSHSLSLTLTLSHSLSLTLYPLSAQITLLPFMSFFNDTPFPLCIPPSLYPTSLSLSPPLSLCLSHFFSPFISLSNFQAIELPVQLFLLQTL